MNSRLHFLCAETKPGKSLLQKAHEPRVGAYVALIAAIALQSAVPEEFTPTPGKYRYWLIAMEVLLLLLLIVSNRVRITRLTAGENTVPGTPLIIVENAVARALLVVITINNAVSAAVLDWRLLHGVQKDQSAALLFGGGAIFLTNIIVVAIWYWFHDLGGPSARENGEPYYYPDFLFPQYGINNELAPQEWRPHFLDYLYVSFTNVVAFSPTDAMPLTKRAKAMMALQSSVAITTVALVFARAVNVL